MDNLTIDSKPKTYDSKINGYKIAGVTTAWIAEPYIKAGLQKTFFKCISSVEKKAQGGDFKPYAQKAIQQHNIESLKLYDLNEASAEQLAKELKIGPPDSKTKAFFKNILRIPVNAKQRGFQTTLKGNNAFFIPYKNMIVCNFEKYGSPVFHEIGHKLNKMSKNPIMKSLNFLKIFSFKILPTLISLIAILKDPKDKKDPSRNINDFIKSNCGLLATASVLPLTIEECIASIKGQQVAKKAGVSGELLKKVTLAHKISATSYIFLAIFTGVSIQLASKLRDIIATQKINVNNS